MATRPKLPPQTVPLVDAQGRVNIDWYRYLAQMPVAGDVETTAGAGGVAVLPPNPEGFVTITVNGEKKRQPFYPVS
jgi:hypothetical protein